jgi:molybdate transport system substrate-binding protein
MRTTPYALLALILCTASVHCAASEVRIAAAADLTAAMQEVGPAFEHKTGIHPVFTFGASGLISRQIEQGAPFDVFASANQAFVDALDKKGLTLPGTSMPYAVGHIGIFSAQLTPKNVKALTEVQYRKIAIANPKTAPYGHAAQEALTAEGIWQAVEPKLVIGENIRQTQQFALSGNADAAIVSASQGIEAKGKGSFRPIPDKLHSPIVQAVTILKTSSSQAEARAFVAFLTGKEGQAILHKYGFTSPRSKQR